jgi:hypothetical protein
VKKLASGFHSKLTSSRPARFLKHTRGRGDAAEQLRTRRTERTMGRVVCVTASYYQYRTALGELKKKEKEKRSALEDEKRLAFQFPAARKQRVDRGERNGPGRARFSRNSTPNRHVRTHRGRLRASTAHPPRHYSRLPQL